jgi:hypothetical protein
MFSTTIVVEREELVKNRKVQHLVYFISGVLRDSKTRYFHIMKLAYTLLITYRKLLHYFQAHQIEVHTLSTLGEVLNNKEATEKTATSGLYAKSTIAAHDLCASSPPPLPRGP